MDTDASTGTRGIETVGWAVVTLIGTVCRDRASCRASDGIDLNMNATTRTALSIAAHTIDIDAARQREVAGK